jgi:hypothetical protein
MGNPDPHGPFTHPRACSTNGVVAGFASLRSNTPFIVMLIFSFSQQASYRLISMEYQIAQSRYNHKRCKAVRLLESL